MFKNKKILKSISIFLLTNILCSTFFPVLVFAKTNRLNKVQSSVPLTNGGNNDMVNLKTGDFGYTIPVMEIPGPDGNYEVNVSYNAGIQNNQDASWIGLGWGFNPGEINRSVNGFPDDYNGANVVTTDTWATGSESFSYSVPLSIAYNYPPSGKPTSNLPAYTGTTGAVQYYGMLHAYESTITDPSEDKSLDVAVLTDLSAPFDFTNNTSANDPDYNLGGTVPAYDDYNISGPGISGKIEPVVLDNGSLLQPDNYNYGYWKNYLIWKRFTQTKQQFRFKNDFSNSFITNPTPIATVLPEPSSSLNLGSNNLGYTYTGPEDEGFNPTTMQLASSNQINYFTNNEIVTANAKKLGFIDYQGLPSNTRNSKTFTTNAATPQSITCDLTGQIGGFSVTKENGKTYHYALPVYTYKNITVVTASKTAGRTGRVISNNQAYAYKWLLTSVTGADFVDRNGNGLADEEDAGEWTNFNYGKWASNYISRIPYLLTQKTGDGADIYSGGYKEMYYLDAIYTRSHTALFLKSVRNDAYGATDITTGGYGTYSQSLLGLDYISLFGNEDLLSMSSGTTNKDIYSSINDLKLISTTIGAKSTKYNAVIDNQDLYIYNGNAKSAPLFSLAKLLKEVSFTKDYSLAVNSINSSGNYGKLTLNKIEYDGQNSSEIMPPIEFQYDLATPNISPTAQITHVPADFVSTRRGRVDLGASAPNFHPGDIIKMAISGATFYATLIKLASASTTAFDVQFIGNDIPGTGKKNILVNGVQTKNPPYTGPNFRDSWGYFKSDYNFSFDDGATIRYKNVPSGLTNFDRRTNSISAQAVDVWSLRRITTSLGSVIDVEYESDSHSNPADNYGVGKVSSKSLLNIANVGYSKTGALGNTFSSPSNSFGINNYDPNGVFQFKFGEWIICAEEFYVGQIVNLESVVSLSGPSYTTTTSAGNDMFKITAIGSYPASSNYIQGVFVSPGPSTTITHNPFWNTAASSTLTLTHNGSYLIYDPITKYGGGLKTKKITTRESLTGEFYVTSYDYKNKITSITSGRTASEPLNFNAVSPLDLTVSSTTTTTNVADSHFNSQYVFSLFNLLLSSNYYNPEVIYENVTVKEFGNGTQLADQTPSYDEYRFQVFSDDMIQKVNSNNILATAPYSGGSRTIRISDRSSTVGKMLYHRTYNLQDRLMNEITYSYAPSQRSQGVIEQVFHQSRRVMGHGYSVATVTSDIPSVLTSIQSNDYVKGVKKSTTNNVFDFYSGNVLQSSTTDSYGNTITSVNQPAYQIYTSKPSTGSEMGPKVNFANNSMNRNMINESAASYTYKDIAGTIAVNCTYTGVASIGTPTYTGMNYYSRYKVTLSGAVTLPARYVPGTPISLNVMINGTNTVISPAITSVSADRTSFEFYFVVGSVSFNILSALLQNNNIISASIKPWSNSWEYRNYNSATDVYENLAISNNTIVNYYDYQKMWRPSSSYIWNNQNVNTDGTYSGYKEFDWSKELAGTAQTSPSSWQKTIVPTSENKFSNALEGKNINGNYTATKMAYDQTYIINPTPPGITFAYPNAIYNNYPLAKGKNTNAASFCYSGFEQLYDPSSEQTFTAPSLSNKQFAGELVGPFSERFLATSGAVKAHTGNYVMRLAPGTSGINAGPGFKAFNRVGGSSSEGNIIVGKKYRASVWVHNTSAAGCGLIVSMTGSGSIVIPSPCITPTYTVGNWGLYILDFDVPANYVSTLTTNSISVNCFTPSNTVAFFDDFSVRPIDADMTGYVYDPTTKLVTHTLNEDNFYSRYQYDNTGRLIATFKETITGEKKLSENQYNFAKQDIYSTNVSNVTVAASPALYAVPFYQFLNSVGDFYYARNSTPPTGYSISSAGTNYTSGKVCKLYVDNNTNLSLIPLYQFASSVDNFFTTSYATYSGYTYQGISGYVYPTAAPDMTQGGLVPVPLHRYYNSFTGDHRYTTVYNTFSGYSYEGIEGYVVY